MLGFLKKRGWVVQNNIAIFHGLTLSLFVNPSLFGMAGRCVSPYIELEVSL